MKHWKQLKPPYQLGKDGFNKRDLKTDYDGWVSPEFAYPVSYDLVHLRLENRAANGWWNGNHWEGLRITAEDKILCWKPRKEEEEL